MVCHALKQFRLEPVYHWVIFLTIAPPTHTFQWKWKTPAPGPPRLRTQRKRFVTCDGGITGAWRHAAPRRPPRFSGPRGEVGTLLFLFNFLVICTFRSLQTQATSHKPQTTQKNNTTVGSSGTLCGLQWRHAPHTQLARPQPWSCKTPPGQGRVRPRMCGGDEQQQGTLKTEGIAP